METISNASKFLVSCIEDNLGGNDMQNWASSDAKVCIKLFICLKNILILNFYNIFYTLKNSLFW